MSFTSRIAVLTAAVALAACASKPQSQQAAQGSAAPATTSSTTVKSRDGSYQGEVIGKAAANSKFASLQIGMTTAEVQNVLGRAPDRFHTYESGKRWIPFYFGNDARRMQVLYKGEGCLIFTGGNIWGGAGGDLISINNDSSGSCYQE